MSDRENIVVLILRSILEMYDASKLLCVRIIIEMRISHDQKNSWNRRVHVRNNKSDWISFFYKNRYEYTIPNMYDDKLLCVFLLLMIKKSREIIRIIISISKYGDVSNIYGRVYFVKRGGNLSRSR